MNGDESDFWEGHRLTGSIEWSWGQPSLISLYTLVRVAQLRQRTVSQSIGIGEYSVRRVKATGDVSSAVAKTPDVHPHGSEPCWGRIC